MTNKSLSRREKLELAISQKQAQLKKIDATERVKERKRDTRRKIVSGALALEHASLDPEFKKMFMQLLDKNVSGVNDRLLFDLPVNEGEGAL